MMKERRTLALILVLATAVGLVFLAVQLRRYRSRTILDYSRSIDNNVSLLFSDTTLVGRKDGMKIWEVHADRIRISKDKSKTQFECIKNGVFFSEDKPVFRLSAGKAMYDSVFGRLSVEGGIRLSVPNGVELRCRSAQWSSTNNRMLCPGKVEIKLNGGKLIGYNLTADGAFRKIELHKIRLSMRLRGTEESLMP